MIRVLCILLGLGLTVWTLLAFTEAMLIPRITHSKMVAVINGSTRFLARAPLGLFRTYAAQDRWLAAVAPLSVLTQLFVYVVILILTFSLIIFGLTGLTYTDALYEAGSTLTTLGIVAPENYASAAASFAAAFLGLVVVAVFIGYLMATYGAFVDRESAMAHLSLLAGEPAWGPLFVMRSHLLGMAPGTVPDPAKWIEWMCDLRLNQQVNPILCDFRSTSRQRHWVIHALTVLDATAMRVSLTTEKTDPGTVQLLTEGTVTMNVLAKMLNLHPTIPGPTWDTEMLILRAVDGSPKAEDRDCGITRQEWDDAVALVTSVGYPTDVSPDVAWRRFSVIRAAYYPNAQALARSLHAVPAPWSGGRHPQVPTMWPRLPQTQADN